MNHPEITLIVARAANGVIGADGKMPWHLPADLRRFKQLTMGRPMIMGRKTFDSLPAILEGRRHIVLTRDPDWQEDGAEPVASVEAAQRRANAPQVMVIGGGGRVEVARMPSSWILTGLSQKRVSPSMPRTISTENSWSKATKPSSTAA